MYTENNMLLPFGVEMPVTDCGIRGLTLQQDQSDRITYLEKENQRLQYERDAYHAKVLALIDYIAGNRDDA